MLLSLCMAIGKVFRTEQTTMKSAVLYPTIVFLHFVCSKKNKDHNKKQW